jgi:TfoX/Sxy family transcriptional regulator of competence genes
VVAAFAADRRLAPVAEEFATRGSIGAGRHFGAGALKVNGKIFAMPVRGRLVVKLPRKRVEDLVATGQAAPFEPSPGRPMKEWAAILDEKLSWVELAREAHDFVAAPRSG